MVKEYHCDNCKTWQIEVGDIVEMNYQKKVAYVKGFCSKKVGDFKRLVFIHRDWDSQRREWLLVARQRLRLVEKVKSKIPLGNFKARNLRR